MASHGIDRTGAGDGSGTASLIGAFAELADPGADSLVFWDDSAGGFDWLTVGNLAALAALAVTDGGIIVGNGSAFVLETGDTARVSLGVGSTDSPQFTAVNVGHASDTTITRVAAGRIAVEGSGLVRGPAAATDNAIVRFNATTGDLVKNSGVTIDDSNNVNTAGSITAASATISGDISGTAIATQAEMEAASSVVRIVSPGRQHFHPSAAKGWCQAQSDGQAASAFNVTSVTDNGAGDATITWATDFASAAYCAIGCVIAGFGGTDSSTLVGHPIITDYAAGTTRSQCARASDGALSDPNYHAVVAFGDQ